MEFSTKSMTSPPPPLVKKSKKTEKFKFDALPLQNLKIWKLWILEKNISFKHLLSDWRQTQL